MGKEEARQVLKGSAQNKADAVRSQLRKDLRIDSVSSEIVMPVEEVGLSDNWDDMSGQWLNEDLVRKGKEEEIKYIKQSHLYKKVPVSECWKVTGKSSCGNTMGQCQQGDS